MGLRSPELIGRSEELRRLRRALVTPGSVAFLEGEAGVGKSRLLREALEDLPREARVLVGRCYPFTSTFPLGPVVEAIRNLKTIGEDLSPDPVCGALHEVVPELSPLLPPALEPLKEHAAQRHRLFRAIDELLASARTTALVIEDAHWSDPETADLVAYLVSRSQRVYSVILSFRAEDIPTDTKDSLLGGGATRGEADMIAVRPLTQADVGRLVKSILGAQSISAEFVSYLYEKTAGVPFVVEELLHLLTQRNDIRQRDGEWERRAVEQIRVPPAVRDATLERVRRFPDATQELLRAAAMFERPAREQTLAEAAGLGPQFDGCLASALDSGLLVEVSDGAYSYRHELARDAVYESLSSPGRRALHEHCARALEKVDPAALYEIAHHYRRAGSHDRWIDYAMRFADAANSFTDTTPALGLLRAGLTEEGLDKELRSQLAIKLGQTALKGLAHEAALKTLTEMADDPSLPRSARAEIRYQVALLWDSMGDASACYRVMSEAVPDLRHDPGLHAQAMSGLALPWAPDVAATEHLRWLARVDEVMPQMEEPFRQLGLHLNKATTLLYFGDTRAIEILGKEIPGKEIPASTLAEKKELVRGHVILAPAAFFNGRFSAAESFLDTADSVAREIGLDRFDGMVTAARLLLDWGRGATDGLEGRAKRLIDSPNVVPCFAWAAHLVLGSGLAGRGRARSAVKHLQAALDIAPGAGSLVGGICAGALLARLHAHLGDRTRAASLIDSLAEDLDRKGMWLWGGDLCATAVDVGHASTELLVERLSDALDSGRSDWATASHAYCRAGIAATAGDLDQAKEFWGNSLEVWDRFPRPVERARSQESMGLALLDAGDESGVQLLESAIQTYSGIGASVYVDRIRRALREHGVPVQHRRGRKGYGDELSPRERDVALLVAEGHSNKEIAALLSLSHRTVEDHVASAIRKLGLESRAGLADGSGALSRGEPTAKVAQ